MFILGYESRDRVGEMPVTVGELLKLPQLQMRLVAGSGGLDREISWVHTSDLPEPWRWLGSGELLLTNGTGLSPDPGDQVRFVERLAEAGASGLGIGLGIPGPPLSQELYQRAEELRLPVVTVPFTMSFSTVVRAVADANSREERQRRLCEELFSQLLDRRIDPGAAEPRLAETGLDLAGCVLAVARESRAGAAAQLRRALATAGVPHLLLVTGGVIQVVLPEGALVTGCFPGLAQAPPAIGASGRVGGAGRVPEAAAEARWALGAAEAEQRGLVRYGEQTSLLLPRSAAEAQALVSRILGPLITHDAEHATEYLATLRAVLEHDRSWQLAAAALHIHKQTLGYRIRKIEQLTGRGISRTEHLAEWWFALRAQDMLTTRLPR